MAHRKSTLLTFEEEDIIVESSLQLLRSPSFHRAVQTVHKRVREVRHGKDPEELGGTNIDG